MLAHSCNTFYVVTKFILPIIQNVKFSELKFDDKCEYLQENDKEHNSDVKEHILDLITYCRNIKLCVYFINNK